jgi:quercetin dioxygenase-like cupin family protein
MSAGHVLGPDEQVDPSTDQPGRFLVRSSDSDGSFMVVEMSSESPLRTSLHVHVAQDEFVYVLDGLLTVTLDGREAQQLRSGSAAFLPRGVPHRLASDGPTRVLVVANGDYEDQRAAIFAARGAGLSGSALADVVEDFEFIES